MLGTRALHELRGNEVSRYPPVLWRRMSLAPKTGKAVR